MNGGQLIKGHVPMGETSFSSLRRMTEHRVRASFLTSHAHDVQIFLPNFPEISARIFREGTAFSNAFVGLEKRKRYRKLIVVDGLSSSDIDLTLYFC